jgi:hypothetical protein
MALRPEPLTRERLEAARPKVIKAIITKARRYAVCPQEGYAAGCYLQQKAPMEPKRGAQTMSQPTGRSDELAWVYGVAEQEVPLAYYSWHVDEEADGTYELLLTLRWREPRTKRWKVTVKGKGMTMPKVTVYQYTTFDPRARSMRIAPRWATRKAIENLNRAKSAAVILNDTEMEIDESYVDRDGMTEVGFGPS